MESTVQNFSNDAGQVMAGCLRNSVVLTSILENFSTKELLKLSLVSMYWNYAARSVMRKRGSVIAILTPDDSCRVLQSFLSVLRGMGFVVPFSGMHISMNERNHSDMCANGALDPINEGVLDQISWTNFSVQLCEDWWDYKHCPALQLVRKVLQKFCWVLEELSLDIRSGHEEFIAQVVTDYVFPRLKILKFPEECDVLDECDIDVTFMKALVSRAPRLQELHSGGHSSLLLSLLEASSAVLVCSTPVFAPFEDISEDVISALRLTKMELEYDGPEFNFDRFNKVTPMLLQASCTKTLRYVRVDAVLAVPLMCYGVCLENVKDLAMVINYNDLEPIEPRIFQLVKHFDFTRIFPNVSKVGHFTRSEVPELFPDHMNAIIGQANWQDPLPDRAVNIKTLDLYECTLPSSTAQFFVQMFPSIDSLYLNLHGGSKISFGSIWKHWVDLKEIIVFQYDLQEIANLDSVFCGIFPEEVAELREKDEDYLLRVNIVPVMPAITCLRNLTTLKLHYQFPDGLKIYDPKFIFSKVTMLIAFARCPSLAVDFNFPVIYL